MESERRLFVPRDPAKSKAVFEIELASIDLASEETEVEARRPAWFDTAKFPVATFESTAVRGTVGDRLPHRRPGSR
jgi:polyisoprenoid-binding protein YceI